MNVETQRGANELHGQGFLFDRQNNWGARNPFTQWVKETAPGTDTTVPIVYAGVRIPRRTTRRSGASAWAAAFAATSSSGLRRWTAITATIRGWRR